MLAVFGVGMSLVGGAVAVGLHELGNHAAQTFQTLNRALSESTTQREQDNARDVAVWIKTYRPGAKKVACRRGTRGWRFVCVFRDRDGRRVKVGVNVRGRQPTKMSPIVARGRRLPAPSA
jgi:hypothetical protein